VATTKPGTGFGLYLAARLATASGLRIGYQPHQPHGATFTLTLPVTGPAGEPQRTAPRSTPSTTAPGIRQHVVLERLAVSVVGAIPVGDGLVGPG
jgi:hypothetical protein